MIQSQLSPTPVGNQTASQPRILAFEMQIGGHHPSYIRNIAELWTQRQLNAQLDFVVTPTFVQRHADVVEAVNAVCPDKIRIQAITSAEQQHIDQSPLWREFRAWKIYCQYARTLEADHGWLMYSDHFQLPMLLGQGSPCPFSCIYFRPTFHYSQWPEHQMDVKQSLAAFRKKVLLQGCLKVKQLQYLFCLDEFVPDYIEKNFKTHVQTLTLPDSFVRYETSSERVEQLREELQIQPDRKILLSLGILDSRKGPLQLLDAVSGLSEDVKQKLCLLLVGAIDASIEEAVMKKVNILRKEGATQIVLHNEYVSDTFVQHYYELADVALTTYQQHKGMSSALMRAGMAGIPVLSASYGLMGEIVRRHKLGVTVETTDRQNFSAGLKQVILSESEKLFDQQTALSFADRHSPEALGQTLEDWVSRVTASM